MYLPLHFESGDIVSGFIEKVAATCQRHNLLGAGDKVVVAVSGGADSTSLLLALHKITQTVKVQLYVAHLNHMMRGEQAEADANWVKDLSARLNVPFFRRDTDVPALIRGGGLTVEQAGRIARYDFFTDLATELGANKVAVGQTQDDQAETVLLHLFRGAGLPGICGVRPIRTAPYGFLIRPLLEVTRRETEAFTAANGLVARHDPYNVDLDYFRNKIRYQLLPWIKEEANPKIKAVLSQSASIWQQEDDLLTVMTDEAYQKMVEDRGNKVTIDGQQLALLPLALQRRLIRKAFATIAGDERNLTFDHTADLLSMAATMAVGKRLDLPRSIVAERTYDGIVLTTGFVPKRPVPNFRYPLLIPGETFVKEAGVTVHTSFCEQSPEKLPSLPVASGFVDYNNTGPLLFVRNRRPGDRFFPQGIGGQKKLSDFFIDAKIPRSKRDRVLLITNTDDDIVLVAGLRTDARFVVDNQTHNTLYIYVTKSDFKR